MRELQEEVDEAKERHTELEREREALSARLQQAVTRADSEALSRRVAEEDIAELEKEKMMVELELKDAGAKHRADARNLEIQLASLKDAEGDLLQKVDGLSRDNADLQSKLQALAQENQVRYLVVVSYFTFEQGCLSFYEIIFFCFTAFHRL